MSAAEIAYLAARVLTCGIWVAASLYKITHIEHTLTGMRVHGVPWPKLVFPCVIVFELTGAALLVADRYVWLVALAWIVFLVPASWLYHFRVVVRDGRIEFYEFISGFKNVSIAGGLLALILLDDSRPLWLFAP